MISFDNYVTNPSFISEVSFDGGSLIPMPAYLKKPLLAGLVDRLGYTKIEFKLSLPGAKKLMLPNLNSFLGCKPIADGDETNETHEQVMTRTDAISALTPKKGPLYRAALDHYANFSSYLTLPPNLRRYVGRDIEQCGVIVSRLNAVESAKLECAPLFYPAAPPPVTSRVAPSQIWSGPAVPIYPIVKAASFDTRSQYTGDRAYSSNLRGVTRNAWRTISLEYACPAEWYHGPAGLAELEYRGQGTEIVCVLSPMPLANPFTPIFGGNGGQFFELLPPDTTIHGVVSGISSSLIRHNKQLGSYYSVRVQIEACV